MRRSFKDDSTWQDDNKVNSAGGLSPGCLSNQDGKDAGTDRTGAGFHCEGSPLEQSPNPGGATEKSSIEKRHPKTPNPLAKHSYSNSVILGGLPGQVANATP